MELYSFKFKGIDSRNFGIAAIGQLPSVAERKVMSVDIPGRYSPVYTLENMRKTYTLPLTLRTLDNHRSASEINAWLQGAGELVLSTEPDKYYKAYVSSAVTPRRMSSQFGNFLVIFTVEPFRYSVFDPMNTYNINLDDDKPSETVDIYCRGTAPCEPLMFVRFGGKLQITVNNAEIPFIIESSGQWNKSDPQNMYYEYQENEIFIDCSAKLAYIDSFGKKQSVTNRTSGVFPALDHEDNFVELKLLSEPYITDGRHLAEFKCRNNERWH